VQAMAPLLLCHCLTFVTGVAEFCQNAMSDNDTQRCHRASLCPPQPRSQGPGVQGHTKSNTGRCSEHCLITDSPLH